MAQKTTSLRSPLRAIEQSMKGAKKGLKQAARTQIHGYTEGDIVKPMGERTARVAPVRAFQELFKALRDPANSDLPTVTGKDGKEYIPPKVVAYKIAEVLSGPAQSMLRMLPYGDRPFIEAEKARILNDIGANEYNLKGEQLDRFVIAPPREIDNMAELRAQVVSHQEDNAVTKKWVEWTNSLEGQHKGLVKQFLGSGGKILARGGISPFMKTLINYTRQGVELSNPMIPAVSSIHHMAEAAKLYKSNHVKNKQAIRDHIVKSQEYTAKSVVGYLLGSLAASLADMGVWETTEWSGEKEAAKRYAKMAQGRLNLSGLARALTGKDPKQQDGDVKISTLWMSVPGFVMNVQNNVRSLQAKEAKRTKPWIEKTTNKHIEDVLDRAAVSAKTLLDLPIARGGLTIADSLKAGNFDFTEDLMSTVTAPFHQNVFKDFNKIYYRDLRQRRGTGSLPERISDRLQREVMLSLYPWLSEEKLDEMLPKIYSPYTGKPAKAIPRSSLIGEATWAFDPFEVIQANLDPVESGLLEFQNAVINAGLPDDVYPTVPGKRSTYKDKHGERRGFDGNRDLLQKANQIHGEEIAKAWDKFQRNNLQRGDNIKSKIAAWKAYWKNAQEIAKRRISKELSALVDEQTFDGAEYEGEQGNE